MTHNILVRAHDLISVFPARWQQLYSIGLIIIVRMLAVRSIK